MLEEPLLQFLKSKGYTILHLLGRGNTRTAYQAEYHSGDLRQYRVIKIPHSTIDSASICTFINTSKRDLNNAEVKASNLITHDNIIKLYDCFRYEDKTITVEEDFHAQDLEGIVKRAGKLSEDAFFTIFTQTLDAVAHLNDQERVLHRDIKPSNILVSSNQKVKLTDLQNCKKINDIKPELLPTRGGTAYTHPELLNGVVERRESHASVESEIYALGASMYFALTGKEPFPYALREDPQGIVVSSGNLRLSLVNNQAVIEKIDESLHQKLLQESLELVPKRFLSLLRKTMSIESHYKTHHELKEDFARIARGFTGDVRQGILNAIIPAAVASGITAISVLGAFMYAKETENTLPRSSFILKHELIREFDLEDLKGRERMNVLKQILHSLEKISRELPQKLQRMHSEKEYLYPKSTEQDFIQHFKNYGAQVQTMSERLIGSLFHACLLEEDRINQFFPQRMRPSFVPKSFLDRYAWREESDNLRAYDNTSASVYGIAWLKQQLGKKSVEEVFAGYFCEEKVLRQASIVSRNTSYFGRGSVHGYSSALSTHERELINTAVAMYLCSDERGNPQFYRLENMITATKRTVQTAGILLGSAKD